ncbi:MAG TPA: Nramp family divalent metal transporter [Steroidobacteraceae bacterium]|nr:Nramp family divalent metal transporter [Steroidobacteraceae bacterium]
MSTASAQARTFAGPETRTGLDAWVQAELPAPPLPKGLSWLGVVGPGVIVLGVSIGSGEFLLGPAAFVKYGLSLLWVTLVAVFLQAIFNTEVMRYVVATGEPAFSGFMRTRPSAAAWAWVYAGSFFLQVGWPAWAATSAGILFFLGTGRLAGPDDGAAVYYVGVGLFLMCVLILLLGRRVARTLEILNWALVVVILGGFLVMALAFVPGRTWLAAALGLGGFDISSRSFVFLPSGADFFLLGALAAYSGCGGILNIGLGNWARDKGYGMAGLAGFIPAAIGGERMNLAHHGFKFTPDAEAMSRWRGWWRIVRADQWAVFFVGAILGMVLPALLYVSFMPQGVDIRGPGMSAALAESIGGQVAPWLSIAIALLGAWLLFKCQLDIVDCMTRTMTDILWSGSRRVREWRGGDVRRVYYAVLAIVVVWGIVALKVAQPIVLLQLSANIAGVIFVVASFHLLYINTRLLPTELRPPLWRRVGLVGTALFYGFFVVLSARSLL